MLTAALTLAGGVAATILAAAALVGVMAWENRASRKFPTIDDDLMARLRRGDFDGGTK